MTDYAWFPVTGDGETPTTAYTWTDGQISYSTPDDWANVDIDPPYPISTGTVPGAVIDGVAQDSIYLFSGAASSFLVNLAYQPDPSKGDPYIAENTTLGEYYFPTDILLNSGSLAVDTLGMQYFEAGPSVPPPTLEVMGASLDVQGSIVTTYSTNEYPAGLGSIVADGAAFDVFPTPGGIIDIGDAGHVTVGGTIQTGITFNFEAGTGNLLDLAGVTEAAATDGTYTVGGSITGFGTGDEIDLSGIASTIVNSYTYDATTGVLDINVGDPTDILISVTGTDLTTASLKLENDGSGGLAIVSCYAAGTHIATARGPVAVEALTLSDHVATRASGYRPIRWIGHRSIDLTTHIMPERVRPVRIRAGAFGANLPCRDLLMSPDHAVYVEDVLIPVKHLVNGHSIAPVAVDSVTYFHVELASHDILLAEGLPAESYLDTGDRASFADAAAPVLYPLFGSEARDVAMIHDALGCAPLKVTGPEVDRARAMIAAMAETAVAA